MSYTRERDTPESYNIAYDGDMPQRDLTDFVVTRGDEKVSICTLDDKEGGPDRPMVARGTLTKDKTTMRVVTRPLVEWCIDYTAEPHLWVRSERIWYRLFKPAKDYTRAHDQARRRTELCVRIYILCTTLDQHECTYRTIADLLSQPYGAMRPYQEKDILAERNFIISQAREFANPRIKELPFFQELSEKKPSSAKKVPPIRTKKNPSASPPSDGPTEGSPRRSPPPTQPPKSWIPSAKLDDESLKKMFKRAEKHFTQIIKLRNSYPFRAPVDPERDGCPDYLTRIRNPMDLGTIKRRLESGKYTALQDVAADFYLVASNCREYNGDNHDFTKWIVEMHQKFENGLRSAEETEVAAMAKRNNANKKRRASADLPPSGKGVGKKSAPKAARKASTPKSLPPQDVSPTASSPSTRDEDSGPRKPCARSESQNCDKLQLTGSKYCSDECGLIVARKRLSELNRAGFSADEYVKAFINKALVHRRS